MAVTKFGKELRKLRIEHDQILKDMAEDLGISVAMLSAIELGNRKIPKNFVENLVELYDLSFSEADNLYSAAIDSEKAVEFNLDNTTDDTSLFLKAFAREIRQGVDEEKIRKMLKMMRE